MALNMTLEILWLAPPQLALYTLYDSLGLAVVTQFGGSTGNCLRARSVQ